MKTMPTAFKTITIVVTSLLLFAGAALAAEIHVMNSGGFSAAYRALAPEFEAATKNTLVIEVMQARLDQQPDAMQLRRQTVEHPFGTLKAWMGSTHFLTKRLPRVSTEMSLHVLAYNLKRVMQILGIVPLMQAMRA